MEDLSIIKLYKDRRLYDRFSNELLQLIFTSKNSTNNL